MNCDSAGSDGYERPDLTEIPLCLEGSFLNSMTGGYEDSDPDEEGSEYWAPFGPGEGVPD